MKLNNAVLSQSLPGYALPQYDRQAMARRSRQQPTWLHFGAGNLFRAFPAVLAQRLLNAGETDTGVLCCEAYDTDAVTQFLRPYDDLTLSVSLLADGSMEKEVVGSIAQSLTLPQDRCRVEEIFRAPSLQMVSFTITEKGYAVNAAVKEDMGRAPGEAQTLLGALAACCLARFEACGAPLALVSMDNCSQNGEKLREGFFAVLDAWKAAGHVSPEAYAWAQEKLSFPWSMIDKITPRPHESVQKALAADGWEGMDIQVTGKNTYIAPFVNTEKPQYLVIEDDFPAGRPPLEKAGVLFTSRDTVNAVERMKVCTCLNPLHTTLAQRFPNPFIPDTPQRIATDTSQKLPIRFGVDMGLHLERGTAGQLQRMPLVLAGWLRYLKAVDDQGQPFTCSPDPLLEKVQPIAQAIPFGTQATQEDFGSLLEDASIWGVDLKAAGLSALVVEDFNRLNQGPGAVRATLEQLRKG